MKTPRLTTLSNKLNRKSTAHKSQCGRLGLIVGSDRYVGAATLAAQAALRSGVGYVVVFSVPSVITTLHVTCPEAIGIPLLNAPHLTENHIETLLSEIQNFTLNSLVIGCGLGPSPQTQTALQTLVTHPPINALPKVIVSDAIAHLKTYENPHCIYTPHEGEFKTLSGQSLGKTPDDTTRHNALETFCRTKPYAIALKGHHTLVAQHPHPIYMNTTGNPAMAVAGMGDVLAGCIGALIAQGLTPYEAGILGTFAHGKAGDLAEKIYKNGTMPSDLFPYLGACLQ